MSCVKKMIIDSLCPPAVLYMGFSVIQIIIDLFRGQQNSAFLKVIVMTIFTLLLNQLCIGGLTILSWFIVFIPFIMMTYITTILLYVFGLNPSRGKHHPHDPRRRHRHKPHPRPYNPQDVGGCAGTEFGCCPDGVTASNMFGSNCYGPGPGPQPAPPHHHHHHHHGHHYPPGPSPSPVPPGPSPSPSNYSCTPMAPGKNPSCHPDMNGIYTSIAECEQDPNCPGPSPGPQPQKFSCMKKHGLLTCLPDQSGDYSSRKECETQCKPAPVPHHPTKKPNANNYSCANGSCAPGSSCTIDDVTCFSTSDSCADGCLPSSVK